MFNKRLRHLSLMLCILLGAGRTVGLDDTERFIQIIDAITIESEGDYAEAVVSLVQAEEHLKYLQKFIDCTINEGSKRPDKKVDWKAVGDSCKRGEQPSGQQVNFDVARIYVLPMIECAHRIKALLPKVEALRQKVKASQWVPKEEPAKPERTETQEKEKETPKEKLQAAGTMSTPQSKKEAAPAKNKKDQDVAAVIKAADQQREQRRKSKKPSKKEQEDEQALDPNMILRNRVEQMKKQTN